MAGAFSSEESLAFVHRISNTEQGKKTLLAEDGQPFFPLPPEGDSLQKGLSMSRLPCMGRQETMPHRRQPARGANPLRGDRLHEESPWNVTRLLNASMDSAYASVVTSRLVYVAVVDSRVSSSRVVPAPGRQRGPAARRGQPIPLPDGSPPTWRPRPRRSGRGRQERRVSPPTPHFSRLAGKSVLTAHTASPSTAMTTSRSSAPSGMYADMVSASDRAPAVQRHGIAWS